MADIKKELDKYTFVDKNGVKISVFKNELLLEIDGCGEVPGRARCLTCSSWAWR